MNKIKPNISNQDLTSLIHDTDYMINLNREEINHMFKDRQELFKIKHMLIQTIKELEFDEYLRTGKFND